VDAFVANKEMALAADGAEARVLFGYCHPDLKIGAIIPNFDG